MTYSSSSHVWCSHTCSLISSSSSWARCILWAMRLCSWPRGCTGALPAASSSVGQRCRAERNSERIIAGLRKAKIKVLLCSWFIRVCPWTGLTWQETGLCYFVVMYLELRTSSIEAQRLRPCILNLFPGCGVWDWAWRTWKRTCSWSLQVVSLCQW